MTKAKELRNSPPKYEQNILAKTKTPSPSKRRDFFKKEKDWSEPQILQDTVKNQFIQLLGTSFDHRGLNKNWSSFFLPYSSSWQSSRRKKKKCQKSLKECQWYYLPPAACEVLNESSDEWVYLRKKKKQAKSYYYVQ